jgi:hypothetical protein
VIFGKSGTSTGKCRPSRFAGWLFRHDGRVPRRQLRPHQVWLIGVPLNLLLAIPCAYPVAFAMLGTQVVGWELGWGTADPTVVDDGAGLVIGLGLASLVFAGLVVAALNWPLVAFRAPQVKAGRYWLVVALLVTVPGIAYWTTR